jgi:hypothetical protein
VSQACPVSFKQVDENAARINAVLSAVSVVLFLATSYKFIMFFLAIDFFIRGFIDPLYSFYSAISKSFLRMMTIRPKLIEGSPKIFAAKMGFVFSTLIILFAVIDFQIVVKTIGIALIIFALLEGAFGICVGCNIYSFIERYKKTQRN